MYEIAISPNSQQTVPSTRYDVAVGFRFQDRLRAESFCRELNLFCFQERFLVIRAGQTSQAAQSESEQVLQAAA